MLKLTTPTSTPLLDSLREALWDGKTVLGANRALPDVATLGLEPLPDTGLAHDHVRLIGTGLLARIPKQSQMQLGAADNLDYQVACFERAWASGHVPRLHGRLPPGAGLPRGALLVEEIRGRAAQLPGDLPALTRALAALHALPLPNLAQRAPLWDAVDPLRALYAEIQAQADLADWGVLAVPTRAAITNGLRGLHDLCAQVQRPARHLIAFDGHPGNFVVRPDGEAVLVDLEKCRYSYPGLDLAHATLYTSTTWDVASHAALGLDEVIGAYSVWEVTMEAVSASQSALLWHVPLRRAMWLWSLTWCAKWLSVSGAATKADAGGEDWSAERSSASLVAHVRERVTHYLSTDIVAKVETELTALDGHFGTLKVPGA
jgi:thiamine kinase-like enzyme